MMNLTSQPPQARQDLPAQGSESTVGPTPHKTQGTNSTYSVTAVLGDQNAEPNGLNQHEPGAKLDSGKPLAAMLLDFAYALQEVVEVGTYGATKYTRSGWQEVENGEERYFDAMFRHLLASRHTKYDEETGLMHLAHAAWNILATLELHYRSEGASN